MAKTKGKSGKNSLKKKIKNEQKRDLQIKSEGQVYAQATKILGNCRLEVQCFDGIKRLAHIRGKMHGPKEWISVGDLLLVGERDYQDEKCDVIVKYTPIEGRLLKNLGEIPDYTKINEPIDTNDINGINGVPTEEEGGFTFDDI
jgi:translation initiation factor 1A